MRLISTLFVLTTACATTSRVPSLKGQFYTLETPPAWAQTLDKETVYAGGFSGLFFLGKTPAGEYQFLSPTDRGPNGETLFISGVGRSLRPFVVPDFQPRWVKLETDSSHKTLKIVEEILLTDPLGQPLTGRSQWFADKIKSSDERPINLAGEVIPTDLMGIDPEGLTRDSQGNFWMGEEYRPSLLKFSPQGKLLKRFIPKNSLPLSVLKEIQKKYGPNLISEALPEVYKNRKGNRGFEGITFLHGKIYASMQSPLETSLPQDQHQVRILEFDPLFEKVSREFFYPLSLEGVDKIGDLTVRPGSSKLFAIEQNSKTGKGSIHRVTGFDMNASPLRIETTLSLPEAGYDFSEKVEGLAFVSENLLAVINDNDFGVDGDLDLQKQRIPLTKTRKTVLGLLPIHFENK